MPTITFLPRKTSFCTDLYKFAESGAQRTIDRTLKKYGSKNSSFDQIT